MNFEVRPVGDHGIRERFIQQRGAPLWLRSVVWCSTCFWLRLAEFGRLKMIGIGEVLLPAPRCKAVWGTRIACISMNARSGVQLRGWGTGEGAE